MSCLSKLYRLNNTKEFSYLYKSAKKWHTDSFIAFYCKKDSLKLAFVTSKKIGNAVLRNKARRRMRALLLSYENSLIKGSYIFVAKENINQNDYQKLKKDFNFALKRLEVLK